MVEDVAVIVTVLMPVAVTVSTACTFHSVRRRYRVLMAFFLVSYLRVARRTTLRRSKAGRGSDPVHRLLSGLHVNRRFCQEAISRCVVMLSSNLLRRVRRPPFFRRFNQVK